MLARKQRCNQLYLNNIRILETQRNIQVVFKINYYMNVFTSHGIINVIKNYRTDVSYSNNQISKSDLDPDLKLEKELQLHKRNE